jgi:hypothetical protein
MKTSTILTSISAIALTAAFPTQPSNTINPKATAVIQFYKNGEPFRKPLKVAVGGTSDTEFKAPDSAEIVRIVNSTGARDDVIGAEKVVCVFNKNNGVKVAGQASLGKPAVFDGKAGITRTVCKVQEDGA